MSAMISTSARAAGRPPCSGAPTCRPRAARPRAAARAAASRGPLFVRPDVPDFDAFDPAKAVASYARTAAAMAAASQQAAAAAAAQPAAAPGEQTGGGAAGAQQAPAGRGFSWDEIL
ncbi:hypothetical protein Rsub_09840 [Raphidocelis subcapitata]|uniref:Uncharacterized protein n=1 Tax=Raphidocelis subcapitata TaxID=307507 RepID=A0A2V0P9G4_9CHLO|nr:hypothetical protein Rsub_09840 [Raphidocelis subcapitata]|eukprot:GBF96498.1 hypothetical protein Rsub_09840 [Raphidocelis subcapitata]